jgi:imidazolonepropionase-like amidohydrolase
MRRVPALTAALVVATLVSTASLQSARPPAQPATGRLKALVGGTLIDGYGGPPLPNAAVLIDGERIKAVGQAGSLTLPAGTEVISTEGMSVLPGLWDAHVHLDINGHADYDHWDRAYASIQERVIKPASARQLLMAGVTSARDLGANLGEILAVRDRINAGTIQGATVYVAGPFLQHEPYPGTEAYRWGIKGPDDARAKVRKLVQSGVDIIKMIDQDEMTLEEVRAVVDEAHALSKPVVVHAHRPDEIRRGLAAGADCFEHTGLGTTPEYPPDIIAALQERTARGSAGPLFWTPTVAPLLSYEEFVQNPEALDDPAWHDGLPTDVIADIRKSIEHPDQIAYYQAIPARRPTVARKFRQLRDAGVTMLVGTDSGVPMLFHSHSTWREMDAWVNTLGVDPMTTIRAATYWPAVAMKVEKNVGTVSPGKYADIIAVRGDVLRHIALLQSVTLVIHRGTRVK